jgi:hypothetical protein
MTSLLSPLIHVWKFPSCDRRIELTVLEAARADIGGNTQNPGGCEIGYFYLRFR